MDVYEKMRELDIELPEAPPAGGLYSPMRRFGKNLVYTSGIGPVSPDGTALWTGKLGTDLSVAEGQLATRAATLNTLAMLHKNLGDLNKIKRVVKVLGFVACGSDFYQQPQVMNAATELLVSIYGDDDGRPARSALGTNALPGNIPVEIELILELNEE